MKIIKIITLPVLLFIWFIGWSLYWIGERTDFKNNYKKQRSPFDFRTILEAPQESPELTIS